MVENGGSALRGQQSRTILTRLCLIHFISFLEVSCKGEPLAIPLRPDFPGPGLLCQSASLSSIQELSHFFLVKPRLAGILSLVALGHS